jgi:O-antigen/teichoic acid export membrane protein
MKPAGLAKDALFFSICNAIPALTPLLLLPFLTDFLTPSEYGLVAIFQLLLGVFGAVVGGGIDGAVQANTMRNTVQREEYLFNGLVLLAIYATLFAALGLLPVAEILLGLVSFPTSAWFVLVFAGMFQVGFGTVLSYWQITARRLPYFAVVLLGANVNVFVTIFLVKQLNLGWEGRMYGIVAGIGVSFIFSAVLALRLRHMLIRWSPVLICDIRKIGSPFVIHSLAGMALASTDRLILTEVSTLGEVGIYAVALQLAGVIAFAQDSLGKAWLPWLTMKLANSEIDKFEIVKMAYACMALLLGLGLGAGFGISKLVQYFARPEYAGSSSLVILLCCAYAFNGMYKVVVPFLLYHSKTRLMALCTTAAFIVNLFFAYIFGKNQGALGVAFAYMLAMFFLFLITFAISYRIYPMPWVRLFIQGHK